MKFTIIDIHGCSIVLALLVNEALTIAASLTVPGFVHKYGVRGVQCVRLFNSSYVTSLHPLHAHNTNTHTHTLHAHTIRPHNTHNTHTQFLFDTDPGTQDQVWYVSRFYHRNYSSSTIFRYRGLENSVTAPIELSYKCGTFQFAYVYAMHNVSREV